MSRQIGVEWQIAGAELLIECALIEFIDRDRHFVDGDIGVAVRDDGICVAEFAADAIHVKQLLHRAPAVVSLTPVGARSQPDGEGFSEVFVGMLLRIPAFHVAHELTREGNGLVVVAIGPAERSEVGRHSSVL